MEDKDIEEGEFDGDGVKEYYLITCRNCSQHDRDFEDCLTDSYTTENRTTTHETLSRLLREYPKLVWCPRAAWTNGRYKEPAYRLSSEPGSDCLPVKNNFTKPTFKRFRALTNCSESSASAAPPFLNPFILRFLNIFTLSLADTFFLAGEQRRSTISLMITVENRETKHTYRVRYIPVDLLWSVQDANIYYGLGLQALNKRHHLTRDLHIDVQKGLALYGPKRSSITIKPTDLRIPAVSFLGVCCYLSIFGYSQRLHFSISFNVILLSMFRAVNHIEAKYVPFEYV
ncbi:hypothetical protein GQX74_004932 [Glossina fuscipes]|nr:hypothetical protein GQX74_004932 [Glossina fuscipes]